MAPPTVVLLGPPEIHLDLAVKPSVPSSEGDSSDKGTNVDTIIPPIDNLALADKPPLPDAEPPMGLTENGSVTYLATGNPCLDFFFHILPDTKPEDLIRWLESAWSFDSLTTLKLICNLRGVRGTGKSDKEGFYRSALWLHEHHPKTLARNVGAIADFGYFKDLLEIMYRILEGSDVRKIAKEEKRKERKRKKSGKRRGKSKFNFKRNQIYEDEMATEDENEEDVKVDDADKEKMEEDDSGEEEKEASVEKEGKKLEKMEEDRRGKLEENLTDKEVEEKENLEKMEEDNEEKEDDKTGKVEENLTDKEAEEKENLEKMEEDNAEKEEEGKKEVRVVLSKEEVRALRKEKDLAKAKKALEKYNLDSDYRFLHDEIANLFAEKLKSDLQLLKSGELNKISLASKWCPTINSSYDKSTLICESIAKRVFPRESDPDFAGIEEAHYVYRVRDRLRKQVLVPLHKALQLPEVYMSSKRWGSLPYNRVPSVAMKKYKEFFTKHDKERFAKYLEDVKSGKAKIAAGALLPHEIIGSLGDEDGGKVAELQWTRMVEDISKKGKLSNCIAVCDVSGSMEGTPMEVCVSLGLLVSELSEDPWKGKVITFDDDPKIHQIEGDTLLSKTEFIREMDWGTGTNFQKVFDRILEVAVDAKLSDDQMIKRVFVFSDMEFNQVGEYHMAAMNLAYQNLAVEDAKEEFDGEWLDKRIKELEEQAWKTDYETLESKYQEKGYTIPEMVFWNLRSSPSTPVVAEQPGVALVSGFSKNILTLFLDGGGIVNPLDVMQIAINGEAYTKLVVFD